MKALCVRAMARGDSSVVEKLLGMQKALGSPPSQHLWGTRMPVISTGELLPVWADFDGPRD